MCTIYHVAFTSDSASDLNVFQVVDNTRLPDLGTLRPAHVDKELYAFRS